MKPSTESVERPMSEPFEPISYSRRKESTIRHVHDERLWKLGVSAYEREGGHLVRAATALLDTVVQDADLVEALCRYFIEFRVGPRVAERKSQPLKGRDVAKDPVEPSKNLSSILSVKPEVEARGAQHARASIKRDPLPKKPLAGQPRGREAIAMANADLWNYKVRGLAIGSLTLGEARRMIDMNERESQILRALCDHVGGYADPGKSLSELIKIDVLKAAIKKFAKES